MENNRLYRRWAGFLADGLQKYHRLRNDAALPHGVSRMSPYLHYGCVSPFRIAREALAQGGPGADKFLDELLSDTYGIMCYQEDVSRVAIRMAGFSDAAADGLRKVLSKKDKVRQLRDYRQRFVAGARARLAAGEDDIAEICGSAARDDEHQDCENRPKSRGMPVRHVVLPIASRASIIRNPRAAGQRLRPAQ